MTRDRERWLALTVEQPLEPGLAICDAHHHLWEYPGQRYLVEELRRDAAGHRLLRTVYVECLREYRNAGPPALRPVGETEFVHRLTAACAAPQVAAGIVGFADLRMGAAVREVLEAHLAASDRFRGVRYATAWDASEEVRNAHTEPPPGLLGDTTFRSGCAVLAELGLTYDAWVYFHQLGELLDFARALPELTIVLDHAGGPIGIGPYAGRREEVRERWRRHMRELARCPNVHVKLGGLAMTMMGFGWHRREAPPGSAELAASMAPYVEICIEAFGAARCMFESNFPVERASCSYTVLWNAFKLLAQGASERERGALFHDTAARVYRLQ